MANVNSPFGARLIDSDGKEVRGHYYEKLAGAVIADGDFVKMTSSGEVTVAAAGDVLLGVALEFKASADAGEVLICDDPDAVFEVQASDAFAQTNVGNCADIVATAYDSLLNRSKHALDSATYAATTAQLKVLGLSKIDDNVIGQYAKVKVKINEHFLKQEAGV